MTIIIIIIIIIAFLIITKKKNNNEYEEDDSTVYAPEGMDWVELTPEFETTLNKIISSNDNFFITGKAGTGKSTLLEYLANQRYINCAILAPTGAAAQKIQGQTIHSFFILDHGVLSPENYSNYANLSDKEMRFAMSVERKIRIVDIFIIDEISMVRADTLDCIDMILKRATGNNEPFGGKQMVFFGDPFQLPPVYDSDDEVLRKYFMERYNSPYFFSSDIYPKSNIRTIELQHVFRQKNQTFIEILNKIRIGEYSAEDINIINQMVGKPNNNEEKITLTPYKKLAQSINEEKLNQLSGKKYNYEASIWGKINISNIPASETLILKEGAQVMFVKNNGRHWVNGSIGKVANLEHDKVFTIKDGTEYKVEIATWESIKYKNTRGRLEKIVVGSFTQIPLILAWAMTIHKGQGATMPSVHIDLGERGAFAYGQTYVALSRTKNLNDITLERPITNDDIKVDTKVKEFYENIIFDEE